MINTVAFFHLNTEIAEVHLVLNSIVDLSFFFASLQMANGKAAPKMLAKVGKKGVKKGIVKDASSGKSKAKAAPQKSKLNAKQLAQHEKEFADLTLDEKLEMMKEKSPEEIQEMSKHLTKLEKSKLWNRHNTACNNNPELKETMESQKGRAAKGLISLSWNLDPSLGPLYESLTKTITVSEKLKK